MKNFLETTGILYSQGAALSFPELVNLFNQLPECFFVIDEQGRILFTNENWQQTFGYPEADKTQLTLFDLLAESGQEIFEHALAQIRQGSMAATIELPLITQGGLLVNLEGSLFKFSLLNQPDRIGGLFHRPVQAKSIRKVIRESEARYRKIFETAPISIWEEDFSEVRAALLTLRDQGITDFRGYFAAHPDFVRQTASLIKIKDINPETMRMFGAGSKMQILGDIKKIFVAETSGIMEEELVAIVEGRRHFEGETVNQTLQGERLDVLLSITFPAEEKDFQSVLVTLMDITQRKQAEREFEHSQALFKRLFENSPVATGLADKDEHFLSINPAFARLFGYTSEEVVGQPINDLIVPPELLHEGRAVSGELFGQRKTVQLETVRMRKDEARIPVQVFGTPIILDEKVIGIYVMYVDISDRKQKESKLEFFSSHDPLTELFNRRFFEAEIERFENEKVTPTSIVVGDIDGLKLVNDRLGHPAGDQLIKRAGDVLRKAFRSEDIIARLGGDEFAILLPATNFNTVTLAYHRIQAGVIQNNNENPNIPLSISLGFATTEGDISLMQTFKEADQRMYMNKIKKHTASRT